LSPASPAGVLFPRRELTFRIGAGSGCGAHGSLSTAAEHAEVIGDNLETGTLLAFLVRPFAGLDATFDENKRTFLQVLLGDLGLFSPDDDFVPLGALLALAVAITVGLVGGQRKVRHRLAAAGIACFGVAA